MKHLAATALSLSLLTFDSQAQEGSRADSYP